MGTRHTLYRISALLSATIVLLIWGGASAQDVARGYASRDQGLKPGMVVALSSDSTAAKPEVERADLSNANKVIGVTTNSDENLVTIASGVDQVYVQSKGEVSVYATDLAGAIKKGDPVTVSPLKGSVMLASAQTTQIGLALEDFPLDSQESHLEVGVLGKDTVRTAKMRITLSNGLTDRSTSTGESSLQRLGRALTGKKVGEIQVLIALIIFFIVMVAEGSIIYGGITSAITALGRNPLAKKIIVKELVRLLGMVIIVFGVGLGAIYAVLNV